MIKEIALPENVGRFGDNFFPIGDYFSRVSVLRKRNQRVQMIRHQQPEMHIPVPAFLAEFDRLPDDAGNLIDAQLVNMPGRTADGDKENGAIAYPGWNLMR